MSWLDKHTSLYCCPADNTGQKVTFREILFTRFAINHDWYFKHHVSNKWLSGNFNDLSTIRDLRTREMTHQEKIMLKQTMQCFTPSALLKTKKKGGVEEISRTGLLQLDVDKLYDFDINEVRAAIFDLPFVCFVGKSVSGNGLFTLVQIEEPEKLEQYAERCFEVFQYYGLPVDTSKGRNITDLRFVSYDENMLFREYPDTLKIKRFNAPKKATKPQAANISFKKNNPLKWAVESVRNAQTGNRFETVRKAAYTMGGYGFGLEEIQQAINECSQYNGVEPKYFTHAFEGFEAGKKNPIENII